MDAWIESKLRDGLKLHFTQQELSQLKSELQRNRAPHDKYLETPTMDELICTIETYFKQLNQPVKK